MLRPQLNRDTAYFWEGAAAGELRIQQCAACGVLRHPPGPSCPQCHAHDRTHVVAAGEGTLFSYAVHHHPPIPGKELPLLLGLVDLPEGVRMIAELAGLEPGDLEIGMPLRVSFRRVDDDFTLPVWEPDATAVEPVETTGGDA